MRPLDLRPSEGAAVEIPEHFGIGIELNLELEVLVGERHERDTGGVQSGADDGTYRASHGRCGHAPR